LEQLPFFMHPYFENVMDVAGDGHCGFRVVSGLIEESVDSYNMVRLDLSVELKKNKERYLEVFANEERLDEIKHAVVPECVGRALEDKWMIMPDMGF
jgi:histone-lysine N-methyltransferase SETD2